jgi:hypothetical protein
LQSIDARITMVMHMSSSEVAMKSDRLVVLVAPEEKARLVALARARRSSIGGLVRESISALVRESVSAAPAPRTASELIRLGCEKVRDNEDGSQLWRRADGQHFLVPETEDGGHSDWRFRIEEMLLKEVMHRQRLAALRATALNSGMPEIDADAPTRPPDEPQLPPDQVAALERLAEMALRTMESANAALDKAFKEVEATKAYFAAKRTKEPTRELVRQDR